MSNKKPIDFATFKRIQKMSLNEFNAWIIRFGNTLFQDGMNAVVNECEAILTEDRLFEIILSVKGVGEKRANEIVDKILEEGTDNYGTET